MKKSLVLLIFGLTVMLAGCPSTTTKLNALKANYNAGNYDIVLGEVTGDKIYSAKDIIAEAKKDNEQIIVQQAKLIQARARINQLLMGGGACSDLQQAINEILELDANTLPYEWMRVEVAASVADSHTICNQKVAAFFAYDYLVSHYDYSEMQQTLFNYILHWANAYEQVKGKSSFSEAVRIAAKRQYDATLKKLTKEYPGEPGILYAEIIQGISNLQPKATEKKMTPEEKSILEATIIQVEAIQKAMILRAFLPGNSPTNKAFITLLDKQMNDEASKTTTPPGIKNLYTDFIKRWTLKPTP